MVKTLLFEDFSAAIGTIPPSGWQTVLLGGNPDTDTWVFDNPAGRSIADLLTAPFAIYDSDFFSNDDVAENVAFVSPTFSTAGVDQVFLKFDQEYQGLVDPDFGSRAFVEVYDGTTWETVYFSEADSPVIGPQTIDVTAQLAGVTNAQVRFRYEGNWSYWWAIDNVEVIDTLAPGVRVIGTPFVSEDSVPDPLGFQLVLEQPPTADVTLSFTVEGDQLQPIAPLTFTPDNWNIPQTATVTAISDAIAEGNSQDSPIQITVTSTDADYDGLVVNDAIARITEDVIPRFPSYRTVEATYRNLSRLATQNSDIARWVDIGDSYNKKTPGGAPGYDIFSLELGNQSTNTPVNSYGPKGKPVLFVQAAIHAREYTTTEVITRFAEKLVAGYGVDADSSWLLDFVDIRIVPVVNPDGRKLAEQGYSWRKNANPTNTNPPNFPDPAPFPSYGVDLNRNYDSKWGEIPGGSSGNPASSLYRGPAPFSEPESQALRDYLLATFPDQKGPDESDPAPPDTTGVYLDVHSFGNLVLYPFGWTEEPAPNREGLRNLGLKFGYFTGLDGASYDVQQAIGLYPTDGTTDDWVYQTFGSAAYTIELGTNFFESVDYFEDVIVPEFTPALYYAAKSAFRPYQTSAGPDTIKVHVASPAVAGITSTVALTAVADDTRYDDDNLSSQGITEGRDLPTPSPITAARYSIDAPSWIPGTTTYPLAAADGAFDNPIETLTGTIDTTGLSVGRHTIFVESQDASGSFGVPSAAFLDVLTAPVNARTVNGTGSKDELIASGGNDVVYTFGGGDSVRGQFGDDLIVTGSGADSVNAGAGKDVVYGGKGADYLDGSVGADKLYGEDGGDRLIGYSGGDLLWGGEGNDSCIGGRGRDTFVLAYGEGIDTIEDFTVGEDRIGLAGRLSYNQLSITQSGRYTLISFRNTELARFDRLIATSLTETAFVSI